MDRYPLEWGWDEAPSNSPDPSTREIAQAPPDGLDNELSAHQRNPVVVGMGRLPNPASAVEQPNEPWRIHWELKNPSPTGGHIVQQVTHTTPDGKDYTYWEAWKVEKGQTHTIGYPGVDDTFRKKEGALPGVHTFRSQARFYEGLLLPGGFTQEAVPEAEGLPATDKDPGLPTVNATAPVVRTWQSLP
ncbi:MAG: hypothetical protein ACHQK9_10495 [Reyranellales bacterium]